MIDEPNNPLDTRPVNVASSNWKNRFLVSSKLTPVNYKALETFAKQITIPTHQVLTT